MENDNKSIVKEKTLLSSRGQKSGCLKKGCFVIIAIITIPYLFNALFLLGGSFINQVRWKRFGSSSYKITVGVNALSPRNGSHTITVKNGKVVAAQSFMKYADLKVFDDLTIERMFSNVEECVQFFPLLWCSFEYDKHYGYPKKIRIDCPIPDACFTQFGVENFEIIDP